MNERKLFGGKFFFVIRKFRRGKFSIHIKEDRKENPVDIFLIHGSISLTD